MIPYITVEHGGCNLLKLHACPQGRSRAHRAPEHPRNDRAPRIRIVCSSAARVEPNAPNLSPFLSHVLKLPPPEVRLRPLFRSARREPPRCHASHARNCTRLQATRTRVPAQRVSQRSGASPLILPLLVASPSLSAHMYIFDRFRSVAASGHPSRARALLPAVSSSLSPSLHRIRYTYVC